MSRWRPLLFLLVAMVADLTALPQSASPAAAAASLPLRLQKRQAPTNIDDNTLVCILSASLEGGDSRSCGPSSLNTPSPTSEDLLPSQDPPLTSLPLVNHNTTAPSCTCAPHWQCRDKETGTEVTGESLSTIVLDLRSNLGCGAPELVCCFDIDPNGQPPLPPPLSMSCGERNILGVGNTFLGFEDRQTQFGEFPWTVVITSSHPFGSEGEPLFIAGGSLVHPQLVLSVAHSLKAYTADKIVVRLGDWNLATKTEAIPYQEIGVAEVLIHPAYSGNPYNYYDVVALVLEQPAVLGPTVNTACLPVSEQDFLPEKCFVSGWGKNNFNDASRYQEVMKGVMMPLVKQDTCQAALHGTRLGSGFILHDSFLCAGGQKEGQDACTGDGGSPLVCPLRSDPSRYMLVGVVAWGIGCGGVGIPGVYADVLYVGLWIDQILGDRFGTSRKDQASRPLVDIRSPLA